MKIDALKDLACFLGQYEMMFSVRRIGDNLFRLTLDFDDFYFDMSKSRSKIFMSDEKLLGSSYQAPFDLALSKYCSRSKILSCSLDGENRIVIFELLYLASYKQERCFLHFEMTGRHTNVILVNQKGMVIEALRHIGSERSTRVIKPQKPFISLHQPTFVPKVSEHKIKDFREFLLQEYLQGKSEKITMLKQKLLQEKQKKLQALQGILTSLPNAEFLKNQSEKFTLWGEIVFASMHQFSYFSHVIRTKDFEGREIEICFSPKVRSFAEGGNDFFAQSKKYKQKLKHLWIQKENLESKIAFLQNEMAYIAGLESEQDLQVFCNVPQKIKAQHKRDYESFFIDGIKISIGKNAKENQKLLQDARADDLWLHIQNIPSSHMIIHSGKAKVRDEILEQSAKILLGVNGIRDKNILVDYTHRRFVKIVEGANVVYSKQKTLVF